MASKKAKLKDLVPDDRNYNVGNEFGNSLIEKSLRKFGAGRSILIDKNNNVIAGNKTIQNAGAIGLEDVLIVETTGDQIVAVKRTDIDLNSKAGRELALADNASAKANIEWDSDLINEDWSTDEQKEWGITTEFQVDAQEDDYVIPNEIETDIVLGDLFEIGEHRLLCGDSLDSLSVNKLLNGEKPDMVYADPPYGIEVVSKSSKKVGGGGETKFGTTGGGGGATKAGKNKWVDSNQYSEIIGDKTTETAKEFYHACIAMGFKNIVLWGGNYYADFLPVSRCWFVWDKEMTGNFSEAEIAWTSFSKGGIRVFKYLWNGLSREGSREIEGKKRMHPTQKPVGLATMIFHRLEYIKSVYDGFLGSGTTMVAAHQLKRKCYGMELDPKYCQIIVDRMLKLDPSLKVNRNGKEWKPDAQ